MNLLRFSPSFRSSDDPAFLGSQLETGRIDTNVSLNMMADSLFPYLLSSSKLSLHMMNRTRLLSGTAILFAMFFASPIRAEDNNLTLNLTCFGSGIATKTESTNISTYDRKTKNNSTTTVSSTHNEHFRGVVVVEIADGTGRIKIPEPLVPSLNTRDNGWFKIKDLDVTHDAITGRIKLNFLDVKSLRIDRHTGLLTIEGGGENFSGDCTATERDTPRKF